MTKRCQHPSWTQICHLLLPPIPEPATHPGGITTSRSSNKQPDTLLPSGISSRTHNSILKILLHPSWSIPDLPCCLFLFRLNHSPYHPVFPLLLSAERGFLASATTSVELALFIAWCTLKSPHSVWEGKTSSFSSPSPCGVS